MNWSAVGLAVSVVLAIFGSIMGALSWFFRERLRLIEKEQDRAWKEITTLREEHKKWVDWIDQRLHAGSESMTALKTSIQDIVAKLGELRASCVECDDFKECKRRNAEEHEELRRSLDRFNAHVKALLDTVAGIEQFVKGNLDSVHSLLAKKTVIANSDQLDLMERRTKG